MDGCLGSWRFIRGGSCSGVCPDGGIGMVLERTVIRHLYGRLLETPARHWGISLMLIQLVRT